jgi:hypothetical protein
MKTKSNSGDIENTSWNAEEIELLRSLDTPESVQAFLDDIPYNTDSFCRSPRRVMREKKANCMEGAFFAAACLEAHGFNPSVVYMVAVRDDGHAITLFCKNGRYGSVAKSNFTGLRYRSPVQKTVREVVLTYFDQHFNTRKELTLRKYTQPLYLRESLFPHWKIREDDLFDISDYFDKLRTYTLVTSSMEKSLRLVDERLYRAGLLGADTKGLYKI